MEEGWGFNGSIMHVDKLTTVMLSINSSGPKLAPKLMYGFYNDGLIFVFSYFERDAKPCIMNVNI